MRSLLSGLLLGASLAGIAYLVVAAARTVAFSKHRSQHDAGTRDDGMAAYAPPVTILKPLCGDEPDLFENLCSFCEQDYEEFQVVFGVADSDDAAAAIARRVIANFPERDVTLVVDPRVHGSNHKISNVLNMFDQAKHDVLVVADSDVRVGRSFLRGVVATFADERVGAATCLYRARMPSGARGWSQAQDPKPRPARTADVALTLGTMFVEEQFIPSVLVARTLAPMDFCLGATMAATREALEAIGGFESLANYLADDERLGRLVHASGRDVALCDEVVEITMSDTDLATLWQHELRWARTMHAARPWGFSLSVISYALPLSCAYWLVSGNAVAGASVVGAAAVARLALQRVARSALDAPGPGAPWLIPARDLLGLAVWAAHFFGRDVRWRGARLRVDAAGRLEQSKHAQ